MSDREVFPLDHPGLQELVTSSAFLLLRDGTKPRFDLAGDEDSTFYLKNSVSPSRDCYDSLESDSNYEPEAPQDTQDIKSTSPLPRPSSLKFVRSMPDTYTFKRACRRAPSSRGDGLFRLSECHESTPETANLRKMTSRNSCQEGGDVYGSVPNFDTATQNISSKSLKSFSSSKSIFSSSNPPVDDSCWNSPVIECRRIIGCWRALRRFGVGRSSSLNYETRYANVIRSKYQGLRNSLSQVKDGCR